MSELELDYERDTLQNYLDGVEREELRLRKQQFAPGAGLLLNRFMVFLLFGGPEGGVNQIRESVRAYVGNMEACAVLDATRLDQSVLQHEVHCAYHQAAQGAPQLGNLLIVRLCPVIFLGASGGDVTKRLVELERSLVGINLQVEWMPFAVAELPAANRVPLGAGMADLKAFLQHERGIGVSSFLCGLFTTQSETGYRCDPMHLLHAVSLLGVYVNTNKVPEDPMYCGLRDAKDRLSFYTAGSQTVRYPLLSCLYDGLVDVFERCKGDNKPIESKFESMDIGFVLDVMEPYLAQLPKDHDGSLSLLPILGIMPGGGFELGLATLYNTIYRPAVSDCKPDQLNDIANGFLRSFLKSGGAMHDIYKLYRDNDWRPQLENLVRRVRGMVPIGKLPESLMSLHGGKNDWARGEILLGKQLGELLPSRLKEICDSDFMRRVDHNGERALARMVHAYDSLVNRKRLQSVRRELMLDEPERLPLRRELDVAGIRAANVQFDDCQMQLMTGSSANALEEIPKRMVEVCYELVRGQLLSDRAYMDKLCEICRAAPDRAADYAWKITQRCEYPVQFTGNVLGSYYAMGTSGNIDTLMSRHVSDDCRRFIDVGDVIDVIRLSAPFHLSAVSALEVFA